MKKESVPLLFVIFIGGALMMFAGFARQAQAALSNLTLTGTVEKKERSAESPQVRYAEPGNSAGRSDRATAIIVNGNRMFILPETIIKKTGTMPPPNDVVIIDFNELAVPCQAKIIYQQLPNGGRNVLDVHVLRESVGANKKWALPAPQ